MKTNFTKLTAKFGCYADENNKQNNHLLNNDFNIDDVLCADVPLKDKAWFIRHNCEFTDDQFREFAIGCALCVLPIYEDKYPENKAPREAIEAAKAYLKKEIGFDDLMIKRRAAAYAAAAADAADAAYAAYAAAAADAAYAAADAAYADAAYAAADAADAADAAAAAYAAKNKSEVNYKHLLLQFFKEFTKQ